MINQQLLDYVRQQIAAGVAKVEIEKALATQGWTTQDVNEAFVNIEVGSANPVITTSGHPDTGVQNIIWTKGIPGTNWTFMVISLFLLVVVDYPIARGDTDIIWSFFEAMLMAFTVFAVFFCLENFVFSKKFAYSTSKLDGWISGVVVVRNLIFLLNFIPFIQILGLMLDMYIGWLIGLIYLGLIVARLRS